MEATVNTDSPVADVLQEQFSRLAVRRRSVYAYLDEEVPRGVIERALRDAALAPNHHRTSPWRFFVVDRGARDRLVAAYEAAAKRTGRDVARAVQRAKDAPVNVIVACVPAVTHPKVSVAEEEFATAAAVQNFLLSLAAAGVASLITTGELAQSPEVMALTGVAEPHSRVMCVVNVGLRNTERPLAPKPAPDLARIATWIE
ncbi:MAG TPA: nitroreductase family protein [Ramlibacter sp.]|uniref:nitroreductase family protein n=1 Tax=Ramlibacter sp. TaxID=1917967 RepID=UPI002C2CB6BC|nr:nitroreductase family protein [Ramlibacter sp.]HVZ45598.1 nitroreductase family protein [Ramlibacter sp.]